MTADTVTVRVWIWTDRVYSQPHGCCVPGVRWAPDSPEVRRQHPEGEVGLRAADAAFGTTAW